MELPTIRLRTLVIIADTDGSILGETVGPETIQ